MSSIDHGQQHAPSLHVGTEAPYTSVLDLITIADPIAVLVQPHPYPFLTQSGPAIFFACADKEVTGMDIAGSAVPTWLSDWRLKLALGSWQLYQELWMELSGAAAACYTK